MTDSVVGPRRPPLSPLLPSSVLTVGGVWTLSSDLSSSPVVPGSDSRSLRSLFRPHSLRHVPPRDEGAQATPRYEPPPRSDTVDTPVGTRTVDHPVT